MTEAGLASIVEAKKSGRWFKTPPRKKFAVPSYLKEALATNRKALDNFEKLANSYKRQFINWISNAKREETRRKRVAEAMKLLEHNQKLGMK